MYKYTEKISIKPKSERAAAGCSAPGTRTRQPSGIAAQKVVTPKQLQAAGLHPFPAWDSDNVLRSGGWAAARTEIWVQR